MDAGRLLIASVSALALAACATSGRPASFTKADVHVPPPPSAAETPILVQTAREDTAPIAVHLDAPAPQPLVNIAARPPSRPAPQHPTRARAHVRGKRPGPTGRAAIAQANARARATSRAEGFVNGVQVFAYEPGRLYEVWAAPYRVTTLTLAPGETVTAKAAGDTVRWQIGETTSGSGAAQRTHVILKPLKAGLETNLVLTTSQRVYMLTLRSAAGEAYNAAVAWDYGQAATPSEPPATAPAAIPPGLGPASPALTRVNAGYRIEPRGRRPRWTPASVFDDGVRTYIAFSPDLNVTDAPVLFVLSDGEAQVVNYRQEGDVLVVDRLFERAELRLGAKHPEVVRISRVAMQRASL